MGKIKAILILESEIKDVFFEFCKYIHSITKNVECVYNINKEHTHIRSNINIKIYRSTAYFKIKKFKTLVLIWKTLKSWNILSPKSILFHIFAIRKNLSYLEFKNDNFERYNYNKTDKPQYFDMYFSKFPKKNKHGCVRIK